MRTALQALLVIVAVAAAGCAASAPTAQPSSGFLSHSASPLAAAPQPRAPGQLNETVTWDGDVGTMQCVNDGHADFCAFGGLGPPSSPATSRNPFLANTTGHHFLRASLTLTWQATSPLTTNLRASPGIYAGCPTACTMATNLTESTGPSPLTITLAPGDLRSGERLGIVFSPVMYAGSYDAGVAAGQPIHLEGIIAYAP